MVRHRKRFLLIIKIIKHTLHSHISRVCKTRVNLIRLWINLDRMQEEIRDVKCMLMLLVYMKYWGKMTHTLHFFDAGSKFFECYLKKREEPFCMRYTTDNRQHDGRFSSEDGLCFSDFIYCLKHPALNAI